ncbi:hypothetical protein CCYA_CCYA11G3208 [Cyanidiococcus yangmingshanensis]|nr:hypothetical protein CCYA_CCYA11G3208 [Cyanidiococcus yangmingshanensis]
MTAESESRSKPENEAELVCLLRTSSSFRDCFVAVPSALAATLERSLQKTGVAISASAESELAASLQEHVVPLLLNGRILVGWHRGRLSRTIATRLRPEIEIAAAFATANGLLEKSRNPDRGAHETTQRSSATVEATSSSLLSSFRTGSVRAGNDATSVSVSVLPRNQLAVAESLIVEAVDEENWQRLVKHRDWIERELLRQVRLIQIGQCLPIFLPEYSQPLLVTVREARAAGSPSPSSSRKFGSEGRNENRGSRTHGYWLSLGTELVFMPPQPHTSERRDQSAVSSLRRRATGVPLRVRVLPLVEESISRRPCNPIIVLHPVTLAALSATSICHWKAGATVPGYLCLEWDQGDAGTGACRCALRAAIELDATIPLRHGRTAFAPPFCWVSAQYVLDDSDSQRDATRDTDQARRYRMVRPPVVYGERSGKCVLEKLVEALRPVFDRYHATIPTTFSRLQGRVILLGGAPGAGKTHLARAVALECCQRYECHPRPVHMSCRSLFQSGAVHHSEAIRQLLQQLIEGLANRPSIIILDDLDALVADDFSASTGTGMSVSGSRTLGLPNTMEQIQAILERSTLLANVTLLLTVTMERLGTPTGPLPPPGIGIEVLDTRIEIPLADTPTERSSFADQLPTEAQSDLNTPADLLKLGRYRSVLGETSGAEALASGMRPFFMCAKTSSSRGHAFRGPQLADIGGLERAKTVLLDTLMLPLRFPEIFGQAPIRLPAGVLLYGMPGTGKTILVQAAVAHAGLRMLHIKGPELLNKYIGASEASVRSLFSRARQQRPCVVFFDEFESLAPRRGGNGDHSTGVTDRIVNALLTELDGVESLDAGVFVVAATCRPDLVDPALVRPGRIDQWIRLDPPEHPRERQDIIQRLTRDWRIVDDQTKEDLDPGRRRHLFAELAAETAAFTGADLAALCSSTVLAAEKRLAQATENPEQGVSTGPTSMMTGAGDAAHLTVERGDFMVALAMQRLSLPPSERQRYAWAMSRFEGTEKAEQRTNDAHVRVMLE